MSTNHTPNYSLSQWERTDKVLMADFNADNAKLDAALAGLEERVAMLCRAVPNLALYAGQFGLLDYADRKLVLSNQAMLCENFQYTGGCAFTGGAAVEDGVLTLKGSGASGSFTSQNAAIGNRAWTQARLWLHRSQGVGSAVPSINGAPMELEDANTSVLTVGGKRAFEMVYLLNGSGSTSAQIRLDLSCETNSLLEVYDYCVFFF